MPRQAAVPLWPAGVGRFEKVVQAAEYHMKRRYGWCIEGGDVPEWERVPGTMHGCQVPPDSDGKLTSSSSWFLAVMKGPHGPQVPVAAKNSLLACTACIGEGPPRTARSCRWAFRRHLCLSKN